MPRIIFHIDVNSAFVSWSATKLVRQGKPDIRLVPSVVSGDPSDRRSIITAASIPAKKLGIRVPEPGGVYSLILWRSWPNAHLGCVSVCA